MKNRLLIDSAHQIIISNTNPEDILIDATLGNGHDTLFLSKICKHVYAFDIQEDAINSSKVLLKDIPNVTLILDSHVNMFNYIRDFKGVVFNLGYLPSGDKSITTQASTTILAIDNIINNLPISGFILVMVYVGHDAGKIESDVLTLYLSKISNNFEISKTILPFKNNAPYYYFIKRIK